ncbi:MAG TPA: NADH-quinone oxidoreductase subunit L [Anaerolineae bacterium]
MEQVFSIAWLIIVFPIAGLLINLAFGRRMTERGLGTVAATAAGASFFVSLLVVIALIGLEPEARLIGKEVPLWQFFSIGNTAVEFGLKLDALSGTMLMVVTFVGTLIHIYAIGYMHGDPRFQRFFIYLNLFMAAMLTLVLANNYLMMFFGWEGVGLCSFLLIGFWFEKDANGDAARKAMVANRIGDYGVMLAMLAMFVGVGSLQYGDVFRAFEEGHGALAGLATGVTLLLFLGVTGKSAQIPLYVWLPDAMAGPTPVSALIHAATMVTAGVYLIARSEPIFHLVPDVQGFVAIVGAATALFAGTIALAQFDIKKVLAYSTVSQLGFMVSAVGMGATAAGIFHLGTHAFFKALLFLGAGSVIHGVEHGHHHISHYSHTSTPSEEHFDPQDMRNMGGVWNRMRTTAIVYIIGALGLAGVVPFAGFWSKDEILLEASKLNQVAYILLLIAAGFTAFYITRQVLMVFFGQPKSEAAGQAQESPRVMIVPLIILAFFVTTIGLINAPGISLFSTWLEGEAHGEFDLSIAAISTAIALGAIGLGILVYRPRPKVEGAPDDPLRRLGLIFSTLNAKYKIDEIYDLLFIRPFKALARFLADVIDGRFWHDWFHDTVIARTFKWLANFTAFPIDKGIVDRFFDGIGRAIAWGGRQLRRTQTGYVRNYALVVLMGVVAIVVWFASRMLGQ